MTHEIKILEQFADAVYKGRKTFEIRKNDRGYQNGDRIHFTVVKDGTPYVLEHPLNAHLFGITYVLNGWGIKEDYCVFSIIDLGTGHYDLSGREVKK